MADLHGVLDTVLAFSVSLLTQNPSEVRERQIIEDLSATMRDTRFGCLPVPQRKAYSSHGAHQSISVPVYLSELCRRISDKWSG